MNQPADINWNNANILWNNNPYVWGLLEEILLSGKSHYDEWDVTQKQKYSQLNEESKHKLVSLYVEVFKDHLDDNTRILTERAGIKFTYFDKKEINKLINIKTINSSLEDVVEVKANLTEIKTQPKIKIETLFKLLEIKIE